MMNFWKGLGRGAQIAAVVLAALVATVALWWAWDAVHAPQRAREAEIQSRTDRAYGAAARDAIGTVAQEAITSKEREEKIDEVIREIRALPESERDLATVRALCVLESTRSDPRCADLQRVGSGRVAEGRP